MQASTAIAVITSDAESDTGKTAGTFLPRRQRAVMPVGHYRRRHCMIANAKTATTSTSTNTSTTTTTQEQLGNAQHDEDLTTTTSQTSRIGTNTWQQLQQ
eukprot:scpid32901/ scgid35568/ 